MHSCSEPATHEHRAVTRGEKQIGVPLDMFATSCLRVARYEVRDASQEDRFFELLRARGGGPPLLLETTRSRIMRSALAALALAKSRAKFVRCRVGLETLLWPIWRRTDQALGPN